MTCGGRGKGWSPDRAPTGNAFGGRRITDDAVWDTRAVSTELATIQQASSVVGVLVATGRSILREIRAGGIAAAADRQALKDRISELRHINAQRAIYSMALTNTDYIADLWEKAYERIDHPSFPSLVEAATHSSRLLRENLDHLARSLQ